MQKLESEKPACGRTHANHTVTLRTRVSASYALVFNMW